VEEDVVVAGAVEVVVELPEDPPPYCARAQGNRENRIGWREKYIFRRLSLGLEMEILKIY